MMFYVRYLQSVLEKRSTPALDGGVADERESRIRLLRAQADLREMELARERSLVISVADYERTLATFIKVTTARVMAIAPRAAPKSSDNSRA